MSGNVSSSLLESHFPLPETHPDSNIDSGMELEQAIAIADRAIDSCFGRHLSDVETAILKGSWHGHTYDEIAKASSYSDSYLRRDVGTKLWRSLSKALGETVSKTNFREALRRQVSASGGRSSSWAEPSASPCSMVSGSLEQAFALAAPPATPPVALYVERSPLESICHNTLLQPGALIRVKAPSLMGKTLLMDQVLSRLQQHHVRTVHLSLELADRQVHFSNLNRFLRWLCINITRTLELPNQIDDYWDEEGMGSKVSCSTYIEEYVMAASDAPLVLCLDDIDLLFPYPEIYEDFFGLLRSWYEKARTRSYQNWQQLRMAIVHSTDVYIQLNINQSPFNVGVPVELPEFSPEQAQQLAKQQGCDRNLDLTPLLNWVGGHPYLLEQAFKHLQAHPEKDLEQILADAPTDAGLYANHLRDCWLSLSEHPELLEALCRVVNSSEPIPLNVVPAHQLQSRGLIQLSGKGASPRCLLYRQYFQAQLGA